MPSTISRRDLMKRALAAGALAPAAALTGKALRAAELTPLDPNDPAAKSLGFVTDAAKVDPKTNSTFKPGQRCGTCLQYQGKPTEPMAPCTIFAGHTVPAKGWCKVWAQRPA